MLGVGVIWASTILTFAVGNAIAFAVGGYLWAIGAITVGTVYLLFATRDLALGPAAIGIIAGVGGAGSFLGAAVAGRVIARLGIGQTMLLGMAGFTVGNALIPLAPSGAEPTDRARRRSEPRNLHQRP
jgi:MFS family permease